jgi:hypothetical protein
MSGRIRSIKPEVGKNADLWDLGTETGLPVYQAFTMLWCHADREGRFKWKPRELKTDILPYFEGNFASVLDALASKGFIVKYTVDGVDYGWIPTFLTHQVINHREAASKLPAPPVSTRAETLPGVPGHASGEGKGRELEGEGKGNDASRDADVSPPSQIHTRPEPTRPDNPIPRPSARAPGVAPQPRRDDFRTLRPSEWSPSPDGLAYARELGLGDAAIDAVVIELRNWKGTRAFTVDWWDSKWVKFVENRAEWTKEPREPRKSRAPTGDASEMAKAREAMAFLRGEEPVRAEVV